MKVFKFGGASVKDADAARNVSEILTLFTGDKYTVVVSAMGKSTNKLEEVVEAWRQNDSALFDRLVNELSEFHLDILRSLFAEQENPIFGEIVAILLIAPMIG
jgi:aspartate kinase